MSAFLAALSTRVRNVTAYPPIEGRIYELTCDVVAGNALGTIRYFWPDVTGGLVSSQTLLVFRLDRIQHSTTFFCTAYDGIASTEGRAGEGLQLQVWCKWKRYLTASPGACFTKVFRK
jgi:hypothetical protein